MSEVLWDQIQESLQGSLQQAKVQSLIILDLVDLDQLVGLLKRDGRCRFCSNAKSAPI
jgi:hypothetical protein